MAKRQFHNLDGVLRDIVAAYSQDEGDGWDRLIELVRIIADVIAILEDDDSDLPDAADGAGGVRDPDVDVPDAGDSSEVGRAAPRHGAVRPTQLGVPQTGVEPEVGHARATGLAQAALPGRSDALGGARVVTARKILTGGP